MTEFNGGNNQLTTFPIQPNMTRFYGVNNQLKTFPILVFISFIIFQSFQLLLSFYLNFTIKKMIYFINL
jgi:hypothetical protein